MINKQFNGWKISFIFLIFLIFAGVIGYVSYQAGQGRLVLPSPASQPETTPSPENSTSPSIQTGIIEGSLSYPSEGIPEAMKICAEEVSAKQQFCADKHIKAPKYQYGIGYQIQVPAGSYEVFAFLPDTPAQKAYYSEFVICGLSADCPSHKPIKVIVEPGKTTDKIDPQDWYAPAANAEADETELIKNAVYAKTGLNKTNAEVTVSFNNGSYAKGGVKEFSAIGGAYFLAAKTASGWTAVYDGQAQPPCNEINLYNFPASLVPECLDSSGNVVSR